MLKGIDVYEGNNIYDFNLLKKNIDVLIQKATQGLTHNDRLLNYRYSECKKIGLPITFYHFANGNDPIAEAKHYFNQVKNLKADGVHILDIENQGAWTKSRAIDFANKYIKYLQSLGLKMGIYSGSSFFYDWLAGNIPTNIAIWLASYGKQPCGYPDKVSWQYSETGNCPGVVSPTDMDYFRQDILTGSSNNTIIVSSDPIQKGKAFIGNNTLELQKKLNKLIDKKLITGSKLVEDGIFGKSTYDLLISFQFKYIQDQVDGLAGNRVFNTIDSLLNGKVINNTVKNIDSTLKNIQHNLNRIINAGLVEDGINGRATEYAVRSFQSIVNLPSDGIAGKNTLDAINEILSFPLCGIPYTHKYATAYIQYRLQIKNDGIFGSGTAEIVKRYQKASGLPADGLVGNATWKKLFE